MTELSDEMVEKAAKACREVTGISDERGLRAAILAILPSIIRQARAEEADFVENWSGSAALNVRPPREQESVWINYKSFLRIELKRLASEMRARADAIEKGEG